MPVPFSTKVKNAWNAFRNKDPTPKYRYNAGASSRRPDQPKISPSNETTLMASVMNQIANDVAAMTVRHVKTDQNGRYVEEINSTLNTRLSLNANKDETAKVFLQNAALSMFDDGYVAIVPIDIDTELDDTKNYNVESLRVCKIVQWYPDAIRVRAYNDRTGLFEELDFDKEDAAIIENPLYAVMNQPNSTLKRLVYKLNLLDAQDRRNNSSKLDLIIQLPYSLHTPGREKQAEVRKKQIEEQLVDSKYGIAYTDGSEKVIQLNRAVENNLMEQIAYLTTQMFNELGMAESVFNGTADELTMLNYLNRSVVPAITAITDAMTWKFITPANYEKGERVRYFNDPFKLVPVSQIAEIADKFTRNEILSPNEVRAIIGYKPSDQPGSDELRNRNLNQDKNSVKQTEEENIQNGSTET